MNIIESLQWRYATKKFDPTRVVSGDDLKVILESGNLAATSFGLQPFQFVVVTDQAMKESLVPFSWNQRQVADASHLIIIAARTNVDAQYIKNYASLTETVRGLTPGQLDDYAQMMINAITGMDDAARLVWAQKQAYIALANMMVACADLKIDSCPMEGFIGDQYNKALNLDSKDLSATVVLPVGYRSPDDSQQSVAKVRIPLEEITLYQ